MKVKQTRKEPRMIIVTTRRGGFGDGGIVVVGFGCVVSLECDLLWRWSYWFYSISVLICCLRECLRV